MEETVKPVTWRERLVTMMKCARWNRCDCPICGLDAWGEGCRNGAEKICPLILDYLEGLDFPTTSRITRLDMVRTALMGFRRQGGFTGREFEEKVEQMLGYKLTGETPLREARMLRSRNRGEFNFTCVSRADSRYEFTTE